jgi:2,3-bisphosphoglycerate-independent phosphoglycerate mutase
VSYRHLLIACPDSGKRWESELACTPPHDIVGQPIKEHMPRGEDGELISQFMLDSVDVLAEHEVNRKRVQAGKRPATMIWLWGQGKRPSIPSFAGLYGITGSVISAVDLIRGIGKYAGLSVVEVPGATGYFDTNYAGKGNYGLDALKNDDFLFVHVESPDEAGHVGDIEEKIRAIENFDKLVVGTIVEGLSRMPEYRVMVLPDHFTPIKLRTHIDDPVPFVVSGTGVPRGTAAGFDEAEAEKAGIMIDKGFELLPAYLQG